MTKSENAKYERKFHWESVNICDGPGTQDVEGAVLGTTLGFTGISIVTGTRYYYLGNATLEIVEKELLQDTVWVIWAKRADNPSDILRIVYDSYTRVGFAGVWVKKAAQG